MRFLVCLGAVSGLMGSASAMTLAFANKWNAVANPVSDIGAYIAPAPNGQYYVSGLSALDIIVRRVDSFGNVWAERKIDQPTGGYDQPSGIESDGTNLYVLYRTDRTGTIHSRAVKLNASLGTVWDVDLGGTEAVLAGEFAVDGTGLYTAVRTATGSDFVKLNAANGTVAFREPLGVNHEYPRIALGLNVALLAGGNGTQPRIAVMNKTTGAFVSSIVPGALNFTNDGSNRYDRIVVSGLQAFAIGRASVNGTFTNFQTRCLSDGSGPAHTIGDTRTNASLAAHSSTAYWVREDSAGLRITRHNISTGAQTGLYDLADEGADAGIAVSPGGTDVAIALDSRSDHMMAVFPDLLDGVNYIDGLTNERVGGIAPGSVSDNFATVGYVSYPDARRDTRIRMTGNNTYNWSATYGSSNFPAQLVSDAAEDATGARYLLLNSQVGVFLSFKPLLLKVNAAGVVQWSRTLDMGDLDAKLGRMVKVAPDGGIVVMGIASTSGIDGVSRIQLTKLNAAGTTLWSTHYAHGDGKSTSPRDFAIGADNSIAVFGSTTFIDATSNALVVKFNSTGQLVWSRVYDGGSTNDTAYAGAILPNASIASAVLQGQVALVRVFSSAGALQWTQGLPDSGGAPARAIDMEQEPNGTLVVGISYRKDSPVRNVIGVRRLNGVAKTILMQSTLGSDAFPSFGLAGMASGNVPIWFEAPNGTRLVQVNATTGASMFNVALPTSVNGIAADRKNNVYIAATEQPNPNVAANGAVLRYTTAGAQTHKRTFAGDASGVKIGLGDAVWATGGRYTQNRGYEATFTKWTQNLGP